jgi:hypothetical protein
VIKKLVCPICLAIYVGSMWLGITYFGQAMDRTLLMGEIQDTRYKIEYADVMEYDSLAVAELKEHLKNQLKELNSK